MGRFNFLRNKVLIISIIVLLLILGTGMAAGYWKLAQNPGNAPSETDTLEDFPGYGSDEERDFGIRKEFVGTRPPGARMNGEIMVAPKDSTINYQIDFKGKLDQNPGIAKADVMFLIDRSMSMKSKVPRGDLPNDCYFYPDNQTYGNSKLCWSIEAIQSFLRLTAEERREVKVGYVTFGADKFTKKEINPQYYKPLADMWDPNQRNETKNQWLKKINFVSSAEPDASGTAMGKAANFALEELQEHGRDGVQKYVIVVTDGVGNLNPLMTGCASWRKTPSDAWPTSRVCRTCPWDGGLRGDPKTCKNPPPPDPSQPPSDLNFLSPYITSIHSADLVDCCIAYDPNAVVREGYPPNFGEIKVGNFNDSPVGKAVLGNIKMPMIGFGIADSKAKIGEGNLNDALLRNIAAATYKDPQAAGRWAFIVKEPAEIQNGLRAIFQEFSDKAATIHFEETLPAGVDVSGIMIERNVKNINICSETTNYYCRKQYTTNSGGGNNNNNIQVIKGDSNGRAVLSFDLNESHYSGDGDSGGTIPFENRRFFVTLTVKTANAANSAFDLDQNQDTACGGNLPNAPDNNPVSWAEWRWHPWPSELLRNPIKTKTPKLCVRLRPTQYTGDVYGTSINNYLFPGIDVLVARDGITPLGGTQAVWELGNYNFSATSFSNFGTYQKYLKGQIDGLIQKAQSTDISSAFTWPAGAEGKIFYVHGSPTIRETIPMSKGRRTIIIEGDLTIDASIVKNVDKESTAAIIVLGNVVITGSQKSIQLGIIAPGFGPNWGQIKIESSNNYLDVLGFLIGDHVRLKSQASSDTQSILYDSDLIKFPPPGLAGLSLPLYQEVAP